MVRYKMNVDDAPSHFGLNLRDYNTVSLLISLGLYVIVCVYAMLQWGIRRWVRYENATAQLIPSEGQRFCHDSRNGGLANSYNPSRRSGAGAQKFIVSEINRTQLSSVCGKLVFGYVLRVLWIVLTVFRVAPHPPKGQLTCYNYHVLVSVCNRLCQLVLFTALFSLVGFMANVIRQHKQSKEHSHRMNFESEIAAVLAQSTTRRSLGSSRARVQPIQSTENDITSQVQNAQGFSAIVSLLRVAMTPDMLQVLLNLWMYIMVVVLLFAEWFTCDPVKSQVASSAQTITISAFTILLSLMFVRYGTQLCFVLSGLRSPLSKKLRLNVLALTIVCSVSTFLRGVLFLLVPVFGIRLTGLLGTVFYPWGFYTIPEILPGLMALHLMTPLPRQLPRQEESLEPLVANSHAASENCLNSNSFSTIDDASTEFGSFYRMPHGVSATGSDIASEEPEQPAYCWI